MIEGSAITEEMKKSIGTLIAPELPPEEVEVWAITRYLEATEDTNPLWVDEEYAKKTRWGGVIAPPQFIETFSPVFRMSRQAATPTSSVPSPFPHNFGAGEEYEFFVPLKPGDLISSRGVVGDITEKLSSSGGRMLISRTDKEYRNQHGELVTRASLSSVALETPSHRQTASVPPTTTEPVKTMERSTEQVCFEDIEVGTYIPPLVKTFDVPTLGRWMHAMGFLAPLHYDYHYTTAERGLPNMIAQGPLNNAYLMRMITSWIGGWGILKKFSSQFRGVALIHMPITFTGRISDKYVRDGENFVELQVWTENPAGQKLTIGNSTVILPSRGEVPRP